MRLSSARTAWQRWQAAAGPWKGWSVCPALLAPASGDIRPRAEPRPSAQGLAASLMAPLREGGVLVILDLEPVLGVHIAAHLNQARLANAVLLVPRWPYSHAVLPVDGLVHALIGQAQRLSPEMHLPNVAFVLDAQRVRPIPRRSKSDPRADNRYRSLVDDLPNLATLRERGIRKVLKLTP